MAWADIEKAFNRLLGGKEQQEDTGVSRRAVLAGLGLTGVLAAAGPALLAADDTEAAEADIREAQYRGRRRRRRRRGRGRGRGRGRSRRRRHMSRREARRRCRSRRYRRRHPRLCSYARGGRRRRSGCIHIGPVTVCD